MLTADAIARKLGGKKAGSRWMAQCPAHDDINPSLSISERSGRVLVHCFAGCSQRTVIEVLRARGLWVDKRRLIIAEYNYTDDCGQLLYQVVRTDPKGCFQRYPDGRGGWILKKHPNQVLYRLCEVIESPIIFVVEGERVVETLRSYGFVATCEAGGANAAWLPQFTKALRGKEVILIPDEDPPGRERVMRIAKALLGNAAKVVILTLDGAKDVTEWFEQGHSDIEFIAQAEGDEAFH